jgi:hypothetical protein
VADLYAAAPASHAHKPADPQVKKKEASRSMKQQRTLQKKKMKIVSELESDGSKPWKTGRSKTTCVTEAGRPKEAAKMSDASNVLQAARVFGDTEDIFSMNNLDYYNPSDATLIRYSWEIKPCFDVIPYVPSLVQI